MENNTKTKLKPESSPSLWPNEDSSSQSDERSAYQLIELHKRFEEDAVRHHRNGYTSPREDKINELRDNSNHSLARKVEHNFPKAKFHNDEDYFQELMRTQQDESMNSKRAQLTLRLPKLENISPENKAIFYTALPVIPSVRASDVKKYQLTKKRTKNKMTFEASTFFQIRPLLGDDAVLGDIHAISKVRESNCMAGFGVLPNIGVTQSPLKSDGAVTQLFKKLHGVSPSHRKLDSVPQSDGNSNSVTQSPLNLDESVTQKIQKLDWNTQSPRKLRDVTQSTQKPDVGVTQSPQGALHKRSERALKSSVTKVHSNSCHARNVHLRTDNTTSKQYSHRVTHVKVTLSNLAVTQQQNDLLSKYRSNECSKTPFNSPRNYSFTNKKPDDVVSYDSYGQITKIDHAITCKSERSVHFSQHLAEVHRYSPLSPRIKQ